MKVFLLKDVEKVGMAGEIIKISDGYATNFLFPRKLAVEVTPGNEKGFANRLKVVEKRQEIVATKSSMLAERIKSTKLTVKGKAHDMEASSKDARLYGAVSAHDIVDAFAKQGIAISKSQVAFDKTIKTTGTHQVTIRLSNKLQPQCTVKVIAE